jgi:hypothetical protein
MHRVARTVTNPCREAPAQVAYQPYQAPPSTTRAEPSSANLGAAKIRATWLVAEITCARWVAPRLQCGPHVVPHRKATFRF